MARKFVHRNLKSRRETEWLAINPVTSALAAGGEALTHSLDAVALAMRPFTIVRTRGILLLESDQLVATEVQVVAMAMAVVSEQAAAIGITAVPSPQVDRDSDLFFVYEDFVNNFIFASGVGFIGNNLGVKYDSKAMRKVNGDQDLVVVLASAGAGVSDGATVINAGRLLVKLH